MKDERDKELVFWCGTGGALMCNKEIEEVTQQLDEDSAKFYEGRFMVGETILVSAQKKLAELLGGKYFVK